MRRSGFGILTLVVVLVFCTTVSAKDSTLSEAEKLYKGGGYGNAADLLMPAVSSGQADPKAVILYGKCLEGMTEEINTAAEMRCYRGKGGSPTPNCMQSYAETMNSKYGAGSFEYNPSLVTIKYTGVHFGSAGLEAGGSEVAAEAAYNRLGKELVGSPSEVLSRINGFLEKYPKGEWNRKGQLLLARINEDIWWVHRNWAWLLYNWDMSQDELIVRGEKYRQTAMEAFKKVKGGPEGKAAKKELNMLLKYKSDGKMYGIVNESGIEGTVMEPGKQQTE